MVETTVYLSFLVVKRTLTRPLSILLILIQNHMFLLVVSFFHVTRESIETDGRVTDRDYESTNNKSLDQRW